MPPTSMAPFSLAQMPGESILLRVSLWSRLTAPRGRIRAHGLLGEVSRSRLSKEGCCEQHDRSQKGEIKDWSPRERLSKR